MRKGSTKRLSDLGQITHLGKSRAKTGTQEPCPYSSHNYMQDGFLEDRIGGKRKRPVWNLAAVDQARIDKEPV